MGIADASEIAIKALVFLAGDEEHLSRFIALSGIDPSQMRKEVTRVSFQAGLMAYFLQDEALLLAFAANAGLDPEDVARAAHQLNNR